MTSIVKNCLFFSAYKSLNVLIYLFKRNTESVSERDKVQGVRSAETGMYKLVHEDFEHRTTPQFTRAAIESVFL